MTPPRDRRMDRHEVDARARHARSYLQAAQLVHDLGDDADVALLATVTGGTPLSNDLSRLVTAKTNVHYSSMLVTAANAEDLLRYARRLVDGMDRFSL